MKRTAWLTASLGLTVAAIVPLALSQLPRHAAAQDAPQGASDNAQQITSAPGKDIVARGKYLVDAGDCAACHTAPGGQKFAGGLYMNTPFGPISTPNITPDKDTGIGKMSDDQFYRVFHEGIGENGKPLYPVMPFPWYTTVTKPDVAAIKAYLFSLQPVDAPRKPLKLVFPFNIRDALYGWRAVFFSAKDFKPDPKLSPEENRGKYLVGGLGHCGECHNGRLLFGNTKWAARLRGGPIDNWYAPNITSSKTEGIGRYTDEDIFNYLKKGADPAMGVVAGPMAQTVHESLRHLTDSDIQDIVLYLKTVPADNGYKEREPAPGNPVMAVNDQAYLNYCASCHGQDGKGLGTAIPALAGNGAVASGGPQTVIRVVLGGIDANTTYSAMPAIGARMTDQEVADATNYVRAAWGNAAPATAGAGLVGTLRKDTRTVLAMNDARGCPPIADQPIAKAVATDAAQATLKSITEENMLDSSEKLISLVEKDAPGTKQADLINGLTLAYCPVVAANKSLATQAQKSEVLDEFAERLYTQIVSHGRD